MKFYLWNEGQLYVNCSFWILTIYPKCHLFQFFSRGMRIHISILTAVQNERESHWKDSIFLLKNVFLKFFFPDERHLYASCLFYILATYAKCLLLHFVSVRILMHIVILTGVQHGRTSLWKNSQILLKNVLFEVLFPRWRSLVCQIFVWYFDYLSQMTSFSVL